MRFNNIVVALATLEAFVVFSPSFSYAYPPTYSEEPPAVNDSGGNNDDGGGYIIPQFNLHYTQLQQNEQNYQQHQQQLQLQQKYPDQHPNLNYFTTTKINATSTSTSSGISSTSSYSSTTSSSADTISTTSTKPSLQAAYVYKAEVPMHIEPEDNKVVNAVELASATSAGVQPSHTTNINTNSNINSEKDDDLSKKIIGSSVVTSVSVILNGNEPEFTDALGQKVPKPQPSLQVASPIDLLNPDRYEFYTFDEHGELVKRLMTMEEIQSIVANGDGEGPTIIHHGPIEDRDPEKNVQDIVHSVQNVLNKEVESNKKTSTDSMPVFDTPDVSSSWSMILPAIFGNTGGVDIFPQQKPQQIVMTPDTEIIETSTENSDSITTKKPKPSKRKPAHKRKPTTTTTEMTPQVIQEELDSQESVYTGMQQYQHLAATMQNYDGFSQLHMQPIFHNIPEIETSTRRVFINNQEVVKKPTNAIEHDEVVLSENLAKKPVTVQHKPVPPHRVKKPNGGQTTIKRPHANKQKIKRKPTTTTTTTTPTPTTTTTTTPETTTTTTTTTTTPVPTTTTTSTTTTTTTPAPTTTTSEPTTTTTTPQPTPSTTTTTTAATTTTTASPSTTKAPKKKKKRPTRHPILSSSTTSDGVVEKPHLTEEKRKPSLKPHRPRPKPTQQHTKYPHITASSDLAAEGSAHQEISHSKFQHVSYHRPRPKPNKPSSTTTTTTTTTSTTSTTTTTTPAPEPSTTVVFSPVPTTSTTSNPIDSFLIVQDFQGHQQNENIYGDALVTKRITTNKPNIATTANISPTSGTSGYPVPSYGISADESEDYGFNQFKKQPLPSFALTQHTSKPYEKDEHTHKPYEQDEHTLQSFDQILQTLKQTEQVVEQVVENITEDTPDVLKTPSIKTENKKKIEETSTIHMVSMENTMKPINDHHEDSTIVTSLSSFDKTTNLPYFEETTLMDKKDVKITARPPYHTTNKIPDIVNTDIAIEKDANDDIETTELPSYTTFTDAIKESTVITELPQTTHLLTEKQNDETTETQSEDYEIPAYDSTIKLPQQTTFVYSEDMATEGNEHTENYTEKEKFETRLPVSDPHKEENMKNNENDSNIPIFVADLKPQLNMEVIKPSERISMSDFQTQAATVASTLVDGSNTVAADYNVMNSNETKDEIAFLMSDVIKQISNQNDIHKTQPTHSNDNRFSNQAQLDLSFLIKPTKDDSTISDSDETTDESIYQPIYERTENIQTTTHQSEQNEHKDFITQSTTIQDQEFTTLADSQRQEFNTDCVEKTTQTYTTQTDELPTSKVDTTTSEHLLTTILSSPSDSIEEKAPTESETKIGNHLTESMNEYEQESFTEKIDNNETTEFEMNTSTVASEKDAPTTQISDKFMDNITPPKVYFTSLQEIYDQQQKFEDKREPLFEANSPIDTTTIISALSDETTFSSSEENTSNTERHENFDEKDINLTESTPVKESATESSQYNSESETTIILDNETSDIGVTTEISTETSEEQKMDVSQLDIATIKAESIESLEKYTHVVEHADATQSTTSVRDNVMSTEQTESEMLEDTATNATDTDLITTVSTKNVESEKDSKPLETTTQTAVSNDNATDEVTTVKEAEEIAKLKETNTVMYPMSEETSAELNAMISEEDETNESIDEDPYIKLGETTTEKHEYSLDMQSQTQHGNKPNLEQEILMLPPPKPLNSIIENDVPTGTQQSVLAEANEEVDEEDEDDQGGYQLPKIPNSASSTTSTTTSSSTTTTSTTTTAKPKVTTTRRLNTLKPVSYFNKQPGYTYNQEPVEPLYNKPSTQLFYNSQKENSPPKVVTYTIPTPQQRPMQRPPQLNNLMISSTQATRPPVKLDPVPSNSKGLEASLANLDDDILAFAKLCNELAFSYWKSITSEKISSARSLVMSPFALTSMLSMVFLGARGSTSGEMNDVLKLDDMVTFNPHLIFKNITDSVEKAMDSDIATSAFVREIFSDRANGKILQFFREKTQQLYAGHVEEVNFHVVNDIIRRRTNLLVKRHTMGKVLEYLRTNSVWVNGPLATISANLFQTDCSHGSTQDRDGELFFQVHPTVRQRRLVPIPAVLFKSGFTAGYEPNLDATVVAFGRIQDTTSMIYVMPGHLSSISPSDNLDHLEKQLMETAISKNAWSNLLRSLIERPGMEVQIPRFSHRSFVNATLGLQKMGLKGLFKSDYADLRGLTGSSNRDIYLSDMIQINTFSTCGEEKIADHHHVEMYPAPPLRKRNKDVDARDDDEQDSSEAIIDFGSIVQDSVLGRGFYDDLLDPKYLELPLPLRPRQARVPDAPRLRFDKPFLYFVRHNPTGMILFMGRFNPRLLP